MRPALLALADDRRLASPAGRALLEATAAAGFSEAVARAGLVAELDAWAAPNAVAGVLGELPRGLDPGRLPRAVLVIAARTLPASAMRAALMARLLGARVLLKAATGQEALAEALALADPNVVASPFGSDDVAALEAAVGEVDAVVVLGSDATIAAVRAVVPADRPFVGYGHRVSAAWLDGADEAALVGLAEDLCAWDQAGCLSPQVAWVTGDPEEVAARLAAAVAAVEGRLPMDVPTGAWPARHAARARAEMLGRAFATETALIAALPASAFRASPGHRALTVLPADEAALAEITPRLSTLAVAGRVPAGLDPGTRLCPPGRMQRPPLTWPHDGHPNLTPLLRPG